MSEKRKTQSANVTKITTSLNYIRLTITQHNVLALIAERLKPFSDQGIMFYEDTSDSIQTGSGILSAS